METYTPRRGTIAEMILAVQKSNPNLSPTELRRVVAMRHAAGEVSMSHVYRSLKQSMKKPVVRQNQEKKNLAATLEKNFKKLIESILNS